MFSNFIKITLRNLWRNKTYGFLNIFGLAIGIACAGFIFLWVEDEMTYDSSFPKKDRLYQVITNQVYDGKVYTFMGNQTPGPLSETIRSQVPGVTNTTRFSWYLSPLFSYGDKKMYQGGYCVDSSMFSMFSINFIEGDAKNAFRELYSIVVTEKMAKNLFGTSKGVLGKVLKANNAQNYIVSGVIKDFPANSTIQFEWVAPFELFFSQNQWLSNWRNNSLNTYAELSPAANPANVDKALKNIIREHSSESVTEPFLFSMNDWRLRDKFENGVQSGGRIEFIRMFVVIAWIILLIACINFMNLATARSSKRAKEVGVRKVLGARKQLLIFQFIGEAICMAFIAILVGVFLISLLLPLFNQLVEKQLEVRFDNPAHLTTLIGIGLTCGLVAGSYPAFYLSSFNPIFVFKGIRLKTAGASIIRKGLVVLQFAVSILLIVSTIIIYEQIQHVKTRDIGYNKDNLLLIDLRGDMRSKFQVIKQDLIGTGLVENAALSSYSTIYAGNNSSMFSWQGKDPSANILVSFRTISPEFFSTAGMQIIDGRDFELKDIQDSGKVVITESFAKIMGTGSAVGKIIQAPGGENTQPVQLTVIGVVKDYVYGDMYGKSDPVLFACLPTEASYLYVRAKADANTETAVSKIEAVINKHNPEYPFSYTFVDDQFNEQFKSEVLVGKLSGVFASLAIVISCLGLFGLAAYTAERRTKEIGIRRVLGASIGGITALLSKEFVQLIIVAIVVSFPIAWWVMSEWLQNYEYRINISWTVFILAAVLSLFVALLTISFQTIRAALIKPATSLRSE